MVRTPVSHRDSHYYIGKQSQFLFVSLTTGNCSWTPDTGILSLDLGSKSLQSAVRALAPGHLRLGGSLADHITYDTGDVPCPPMVLNSTNRVNFTGGCMVRFYVFDFHIVMVCQLV
jgi:hypothetical protein